jgi:hypothetical protein
MADITYTPNFIAPVYRDNVDLVSAEGNNGFNFQFSALSAEFAQLHQVILQINAALQAVGHNPAIQVTRALMPNLVTPSGTGTSVAGWIQHIGYVDKGSQITAQGIMGLDLPDKVTINSLIVTGRNASAAGGLGSGILAISLQRQKVVFDVATPTNNNPETIAFVTPGTDPFNVPGLASDPRTAVVDTSQYKYFIVAQLGNASATDIVLINAFQVVYTIPAS